MPRKGVLQLPSKLGIVYPSQHSGYFVLLTRMPDIGEFKVVRGPLRETKKGAHLDLAKARECGSRREMVEFVRVLSVVDGPLSWGDLYLSTKKRLDLYDKVFNAAIDVTLVREEVTFKVVGGPNQTPHLPFHVRGTPMLSS